MNKKKGLNIWMIVLIVLLVFSLLLVAAVFLKGTGLGKKTSDGLNKGAQTISDILREDGNMEITQETVKEKETTKEKSKKKSSKKESQQETQKENAGNNFSSIVDKVGSSAQKEETSAKEEVTLEASDSAMLEGARNYVNTKPVYKSVYYEGGYSTDQYGVCTDVTVMALKNAGYDLMKLINDDIKKYPADYDQKAGDKNIAFRRLKNQKIYFKKYFKSLTTDYKKTSEWKPGDIAVFEDHVAIVSDKKNSKGIYYVVHHSPKKGTTYEQDIFGKKDFKLVAHYRVE